MLRCNVMMVQIAVLANVLMSCGGEERDALEVADPMTEDVSSSSGALGPDPAGPSTSEVHEKRHDQQQEIQRRWKEVEARMYEVVIYEDVELESLCEGWVSIATLASAKLPVWGRLALRHDPSRQAFEIFSDHGLLLNYDTGTGDVAYEGVSELVLAEVVTLEDMAVLAGHVVLMSEAWARQGDPCGLRGKAEASLGCKGIEILTTASGIVVSLVNPVAGGVLSLLGQVVGATCQYLVDKACDDGGCDSQSPERNPLSTVDDVCIVGDVCLPDPRPGRPKQKLAQVP